MKEYFEPLHDRVIVKPIEDYERTYGSSNIIVPDLGQERPTVGEVIGVGPGRTSEFGTFIKMSCKIGDIVIVPKIGTIRFTHRGEEYYITQDKEIIAILRNTSDTDEDSNTHEK